MQTEEIYSQWLTAAEAAKYLRVKKRTLLQWVRMGKIKGYQLSGTERHVWRFLSEDLDAALHATAPPQPIMLSSSPSSVRSDQRRVN